MPAFGMGRVGGHNPAINLFGLDQLAALVVRQAQSDGLVNRGHAASSTSLESSAAMAANTLGQSPVRCWRNNRIVGYQEVVVPESIQRQSGTRVSPTQTGAPSAPARCASAVSLVITRSRLPITAA